MDFNSILIGSEDPQRLVDYYTKVIGEPTFWNIVTPDVQKEFDRMKAAGGIVVAEPYEFEQAPGSKIATFEDPDGNYFQLMTPIEM